MRRNPRPFRQIDRRKLAMDIMEREARSAPMSSPIAIEGGNAIPRDPRWDLLKLPKPKR